MTTLDLLFKAYMAGYMDCDDAFNGTGKPDPSFDEQEYADRLREGFARWLKEINL